MNIGNDDKTVLGPPERTSEDYARDGLYKPCITDDELQRRMKEGKK
jgi:hypothetical protein